MVCFFHVVNSAFGAKCKLGLDSHFHAVILEAQQQKTIFLIHFSCQIGNKIQTYKTDMFSVPKNIYSKYRSTNN